MPWVTRFRRICRRKRSGIFPSEASRLQGTGPSDSSRASCKVARTAYETVRESFMGYIPEIPLKAMVVIHLLRSPTFLPERSSAAERRRKRRKPQSEDVQFTLRAFKGIDNLPGWTRLSIKR